MKILHSRATAVALLRCTRIMSHRLSLCLRTGMLRPASPCAVGLGRRHRQWCPRAPVAEHTLLSKLALCEHFFLQQTEMHFGLGHYLV